jgi:predicted RNA methylase
MLLDEARMQGFRAALEYVVRPGDKVLELGGGTGVLSFFAARNASKVWCVERNPALIEAASRMLATNSGGEKIELVCADAFDYLPPEPVDVVICEMLHVGLLREKQIEVIDSFKRRYVEKFGLPLPVFVPEACIQAVQPVQQNFVYEGCYAPAPVFQNPVVVNNRTIALADPMLYQSFTYDSELDLLCQWHGTLVATTGGSLNALRFVTKNILAICLETSSTIDWHNAYMVLPLTETYVVEAGDIIEIKFSYPVGAPLEALQPEVDVIRTAAQLWQQETLQQHNELQKRSA